MRIVFFSALLCILLGVGIVRAVSLAPLPGPVISEVLWAGSDLSSGDEWLELASTSTGSTDLSGWFLTGMTGAGSETVLHLFLTGAVLEPDRPLVVSALPEGESRLAEVPDVVAPKLTLSNTKLLIRLRDAEGVVRDQADDGVGSPLAGSNIAPKASMERHFPVLPGDDPAAWFTATAASGWDSEVSMRGTPGTAWVPLSAASSPASTPSSTASASSFSSNTSFAQESSLSASSWAPSEDVSSSFLSGALLSSARSSPSASEEFSSAMSSASSSWQFSSVAASSSVSSIASAASSSQAASSSSARFCGGTDGSPWHTEIVVQSGNTAAIGHTSVNVQIMARSGAAPSRCRVEFGDGKSAETCNPPSHAYGEGNFLLTATATSLCGDSDVRFLPITVSPEPEEQLQSATMQTAGSRASSPSSSAASSRSSTPVDATGLRLLLALPNPPGEDDGAEWVELASEKRELLSLDGWSIRPSGGNTFPLSGLLGVGATKRVPLPVLRNASGSAALLSPSGRVAEVISWEDAVSGGAYGRSGATIRVRVTGGGVDTASGTVLSAEDYARVGEEIFFACKSDSALIEGEIIELKMYSLIKIGPRFTPARCRRESVSAVSASSPPNLGEMADVHLTELVATPIRPGEEWIELWNGSGFPVLLAGFLDDAEGGSAPWPLPAETLEPGELRVFQGSLTRLRLNDGGDAVRLLAADGSVLENVRFKAVPRGRAYARLRGAEGEVAAWCVADPSPGVFGVCATSSEKGSIAKKSGAKKPAAKKAVSARKTILRARVAGASSSSSSALTRSDVLASLVEPLPTAPQTSSSQPWWMMLFLPGNALAGYLGARASRYGFGGISPV